MWWTHTLQQEVQKAAAEAVKDLAAREKTQISLEEKRKHANTKAKKLKKAIHDVRLLLKLHTAPIKT